MNNPRKFFRLAAIVPVSLLAFESAALALDLTVSSIEVIQAVQYGSTKLIGNNVTWVRVKVGVSGSAGAVSGVDASLRLTIDGVPQPLPPIFSLNGPISAPLSPSSANINDTINFAVLPPVSNNVTFTVEVNPNRNPVETNYDNNVLSVTKAFECRKTIECTYVPINYTFNGAGLPPANLMEPGIGDGFIRGIFHPGEWNYHKSPLPPLTWASDINSSTGSLQNTLLDIRNNQLPLNNQPKPNFVYGWLPGNPFSGNGQANGIPGDVAFGNTDPARFQRTFAHELGHLWGRFHINQLINTVGVDVENHLKDTQNLPQIMPTNKNDIMVAGLLTNQAWIWQGTFDAVHNDARMQCGAPPPFAGEMPVLRISGVINHNNQTFTLNPVSRIEQATPTSNNPNGDTTVIAYNAAGQELTRVTVQTDSTRELCTDPIHGKPQLNPQSPLYVMLPETINGQTIHAVKVQDVATGAIIGERSRSARAPQAAIIDARLLPVEVEALGGGRAIRVEWQGDDADGDALTYTLLYSPDDGASWLPLIVNTQETHFEYSRESVPGHNGQPRFRLVTTDGMNITQTDLEPQLASLGDVGQGTPPETFLISPNNGITFPQHAPIAFHATSWDKEDKLLGGNRMTWTSSIDGIIGIGQLFMRSDLSPGTHLIIVTGTDSMQLSTFSSVTITISPRTILSADCNSNGVLDSVDIANGSSVDANLNGIPDECETTCAADTDGDNFVNVTDLLTVINGWGTCPAPCPPSCPADIDQTCAVNVSDLLAVINAWGPCP